MSKSFFSPCPLVDTPEASFSFHCQICFEPLHPELRPPVILPCGHTFLCAPCSKRLKKCMECRTSLFLTLDAPEKQHQPPAEDLLTWSSDRRRNTHHRGAPPSPTPRPVPKEQIPLPLPKNVLLISLMEAAELEVKAKRSAQGKKMRKKEKKKQHRHVTVPQHHIVTTTANVPSSFETIQRSSSCCSDTSTEVAVSGLVLVQQHDDACSSDSSSSSSSADESDFDDDDDRVLTGVGAMTSSCGTYAVADKNGLLVLPHKPVDDDEDAISPKSSHDVLSALLVPNFLRPGEEEPTHPNNSSSSTNSTTKEMVAPYELSQGTKVQIVSIEDGWATLARNEGYLFVESSQLVKVGGPTDKACEIEGMLVSLHKAKINLDAQKRNLENVELGMMRKLEKVLRQSSHAVIVPATEEESGKLGNVPEDSPVNPLPVGTISPSPRTTIRTLTRQGNPFRARPDDSHSHLGMPRLSSVEDSKIGQARSFPSSPKQSPKESIKDRSVTLTPTPTSNTADQFPPRRRNSGNISPVPTSHRHHPQQQPHHHKTIDFRTGRSGHCALLSSKSHAHQVKQNQRPFIRQMGDHRGIGRSLDHE